MFYLDNILLNETEDYTLAKKPLDSIGFSINY